MKIKFLFPALCALMMCLVACKGNGFNDPNHDDQEMSNISNNPQEYTVTGNVIDLKYEEVILSAWMNAPREYYPVIEYGIEVSKTQNFSGDYIREYAKSLDSDKSYNIDFSSLNQGTVYYYRSFIKYITNSNLEYGKVRDFKTPARKVEEVVLTKTSLELVEGQAYDYDLRASCKPSNAYNTFIEWSSSNPEIVSVSEYGDLTAIKGGEAIITATNKYSQVSGSCYVTVLSSGTNPYVDLGLSVKWAKTNVGANSPEEYGDYFAWGETTTKSSFYDYNYKWCSDTWDGGYPLIKYCTDSYYYPQYIDNKTTLERSDDAASVNWGNNWRMPTKEEAEELIKNCIWSRITMRKENGSRVEGYKVVSKVIGYEGTWIFIPNAGYCYKSQQNTGGVTFWTSSLYTINNVYAYGLWATGDATVSKHSRVSGFPVRPVCK